MDFEFKSDPKLNGHEKETIIRFGSQDEYAVVHTYIKSNVRAVCNHELSEIISLTTTDGRFEPDEIDSGSEVVGVKAEIPIGCLKIQKSSRSSNAPAPVVSS